jgi:hypothetical protein
MVGGGAAQPGHKSHHPIPQGQGCPLRDLPFLPATFCLLPSLRQEACHVLPFSCRLAGVGQSPRCNPPDTELAFMEGHVSYSLLLHQNNLRLSGPIRRPTLLLATFWPVAGASGKNDFIRDTSNVAMDHGIIHGLHSSLHHSHSDVKHGDFVPDDGSGLLTITHAHKF